MVDPTGSAGPPGPPGPGAPVAAPVRDRLLTAVIEAASIHGLQRLSVGDVAQRAGLSRQTLYKHFPNKDALVAEAVLRECEAMAAAVAAAAAVHDELIDALDAAIVTTLRLAREHPLLDRLVRTEPDSLLPLLLADSSPVQLAVRSVIEEMSETRLPDLSAVDRRRAADLLTRLLISYAISAPDDPPEVVARFVATVVTHGIGAVADRPTR